MFPQWDWTIEILLDIFSPMREDFVEDKEP